MGDRLAHELVLELLHVEVEGEVGGVVRRPQHEVDVRVSLDDLDVVDVEPFDGMDLTGLQGGEAG